MIRPLSLCNFKMDISRYCYSYSPNTFIYNAFILEHCRHQRHCVKTPGMGEFSSSSLRPLVLGCRCKSGCLLTTHISLSFHLSYIIHYYVLCMYLLYNAVELCNSRAEYHQPQIVRVSREVQRGL